MKSFKKWAVVLSTAVIASVLLVGCGDKTNQAEKATKTAVKELTVKEVMDQTNAVSKKQTGMIVDMKSKQKMGMPGMSMETDMDFKLESTLNPTAIHMNGSMKMMGQDVKLEMYMLEKEAYMKMSGFLGSDGWTKASDKDMPLKELGFDKITEQLTQNLDLFNKAFAAFEKDPGAFTIKKENGTYVVTFNSSKVKDQAKLAEIFKSSATDLLKGAELDPTGKAEMDKMMKDMKISDVKQVVTIDEKTFEVKKMDVNQKVTMKIEGQEMSIENHTNLDFKGAPTSPITVPEDVKKNAKKM